MLQPLDMQQIAPEKDQNDNGDQQNDADKPQGVLTLLSQNQRPVAFDFIQSVTYLHLTDFLRIVAGRKRVPQSGHRIIGPTSFPVLSHPFAKSRPAFIHPHQ